MIRVVSIVVLLALSSPTAGAEWPIKEFEVVAVEPAGLVEGDMNFHYWVERMVQTIRSETDYDPDFPLIWNESTVDLPGLVSARMELEFALREAAVQLESWGFPPPALDPVVQTAGGDRAYRVYLVTGLRGAAGRYHNRVCDFGTREAVILIDADDVLSAQGLLRKVGSFVAVHELVHSVQYNLPAYRCGQGRLGQWVTEGAADAIGWHVFRNIEGYADLPRQWARAWGARLYSEQLPVPGGTGNLRAYLTSSFWRWLAEYEHSQPSYPGPDTSWPADYSYLTALLGRVFTTNDCAREDGTCDAELRWINDGLQELYGKSLRDLYARFMQSYAQYGEHRVSSTQSGSPATHRKNWLGSSFLGESGPGCEEILLGPEAERRQKQVVVPRFEDVASNCWEVKLEGFSNPVTLGVTAAYRPGTEAILKQLTAIMADDSERVDRASVRTIADSPEASWYYGHLENDRPTTFLLANMADQPDATRGLANLKVTFTALFEYAKMSVTGESPGDGGTGDEPSTEEIAAPVLMDFDVAEGDIMVFYDAPFCLLRINLRTQAQDSLTLTGQLTPPIAAGTYPIDKFGSGPDVLGVELYPSPAFAPIYGRFRGESGTLEIDGVNHLMINGRIRTHLHSGMTNGREDAMVFAEFGLQPGSGVGGILGPKRSDHPCFVQAPTQGSEPGTGDQGTSGNQAGTESPDTPGNSGGSGNSQDPRESEGSSDDRRNDGPGPLAEPGEGQTPASAGDQGGAPGSGDQPPSADPGASRARVGVKLRLEFPEDTASALRSAPQEVRGEFTKDQFTIDSDAFDLQFGVPADFWSRCSGPDFKPEGILQLTAMALSETGPVVQDGWHIIDITDATLKLEVFAGSLRLTLNFEQCRSNRCQSGLITLTSDSAPDPFSGAGTDPIKALISGATIETKANGYEGRCDGLIDFELALRPSP